ncbi:arylsulfatase B-like, partial [Zootermopsis nevadensis]|uniref:arylsulfatase B-like n=1 Tax=Zootermopsis nevadensis TaxID=136037 RepID=UPI000B8E9A43
MGFVAVPICVALISTLLHLSASKSSPPHIVFILADDLGWNDVSFHGSDQIPTPNIDALAYNGVILNSHYSLPLCTPSRAGLLTGKYPIHNGMQQNLILEPEPWGLPLSEILLPQYLSGLGYKSHAVGKWHLGFYKKAYTPTARGFSSHFGFWNGYQDYYSHTVQASFLPYEGYDMRRDLEVAQDARGHYSTDLFTDEAVSIINRHDPTNSSLFLYLAHLAPHDPNRRKYAAMIWKMDESVGRVMQALKDKQVLDRTIVIFVSDNGAPTTGIHPNHGSNWPLRGVRRNEFLQ